MLKDEKKKHKYTTKFFYKHILSTDKTSVTKKITRNLNFRTHEIEWDLSRMRISYNLTKTKIEKFKKSLKLYDIINVKTIRY